MKKSVVLLLIAVFVIFVGIFGLIGFGVFSIAKERPVLTAEEFETYMQDKGFEIINVKSQFADDENLQCALVAKNENYQIDFYITTTQELADDFYLQCQYFFDSIKESSNSYATYNFLNGSKYEITSDGKYRSVTKIENTIMLVENADEEYKKEIKSLLNKVHY